MDTITHKFEEAGLGKAPFRFESASWEDWSNCQYCGHDIRQKCYIRDANGRRFFVGNECVNKTGDAGLINTAKEHINELKKKMRHEREAKTILRARVLIFQYSNVFGGTVDKVGKNNPMYFVKTLTSFMKDQMVFGGNKYKLELSKTISEVASDVLTKDQLEYFDENFLILSEALQKSIEDEIVREKRKREIEMEAYRVAWADKKKKIVEDNAELIGALEALNQTPFVVSMISQLGVSELKNFSPRQKEILRDIYRKHNRGLDAETQVKLLEKFDTQAGLV